MKYQIVRTNGKFVIRSGRLFHSYVRNLAGNVAEFTTEAEAVELLIARSKSEYSYAGIVVRELWIEEYHD